MTDPLVWIDCEMTGLDLSRDALVEIACLVTDGDLNILDDGINLVIKPPAESLQTMPELVRQMHTTSGLLTELEQSAAVLQRTARDAICCVAQNHQQGPRVRRSRILNRRCTLEG